MQSHFVVMYDHETKRFTVDEETTFTRFVDGNVYDEDKQEWIEPELDSDLFNEDTQGLQTLHLLLS